MSGLWVFARHTETVPSSRRAGVNFAIGRRVERARRNFPPGGSVTWRNAIVFKTLGLEGRAKVPGNRDGSGESTRKVWRVPIHQVQTVETSLGSIAFEGTFADGAMDIWNSNNTSGGAAGPSGSSQCGARSVHTRFITRRNRRCLALAQKNRVIPSYYRGRGGPCGGGLIYRGGSMPPDAGRKNLPCFLA